MDTVPDRPAPEDQPPGELAELDADELRQLWAKTISGSLHDGLDIGDTYGQLAGISLASQAPTINLGATAGVPIIDADQLELNFSAPGLGEEGASHNPTIAMPSGSAAPTSPDQTMPMSAQQILETVGPLPRASGTYRFSEILGAGGMGVVYRAHQDSLQREVAIKRLRPERDHGELRDRFISEARITGYLDHPNIVPVHDLACADDGEMMLTMKLISGLAWKDILAPSRPRHKNAAAGMSVEDHLGVLVQVCNAVEYAHAKGIVHNDLKPENVMVGAFGEVTVMDWGLAIDIRDVPDSERMAPPRESITAPCGTPAYMAPELALGWGHAIDERTDVYLLGAILFELFQGRAPHRGDTFVGTLLHAVKSPAPELDDSVPRPLRELCRRAMARVKDDRCKSAREFREAIEKHLRHRDSVRLFESSRRKVEDHLEACSSVAAEDAPPLIARLTEDLAGYEQALVLWPENEEAAAGLRRARLVFAAFALGTDNLDLAEAQLRKLPEGDEEADAARRDVSRRREERLAEARKSRLLRWALGAAAVVIAGGLIIGFALVSKEAERARAGERQARKAKEEAIAARERARADQTRAEAAERQARLQLANNLVNQGDLIDLSGRWREAQDSYVKAAAAFRALGVPDLPARMGLWSLERRAPRPLAVTPERRTVNALAAIPGAPVAVAAHDNGLFVVWDLSTGLDIVSRFGHRKSITDLAAAPDGQAFMTGSEDGTACYWRVSDGERLRRFDKLEGAPYRIAISPDGNEALFSIVVKPGRFHFNHRMRLELWNIDSRRRVWKSRNDYKNVAALAFSPSGDRFAAGMSGGRVVVFERDGPRYHCELEGGGYSVGAVAFSPDGKRLASGDERAGDIKVWQIAERKTIFELAGQTKGITALSFDPSGERLLSSSRSGRALLWDMRTGKRSALFEFRDPKNQALYSVRDAVFADEGRLILTGGEMGRVACWRSELDESRWGAAVEVANLAAVASSPDRRLLLLLGDSLLLWDQRARRPLRETKLEDKASDVFWAPDGRSYFLVSGAKLRRFDLVSGGSKQTLEGHAGDIRAAILVDEGERIITAAKDGLVIEWRLADGEKLAEYRPQAGAVRSVALSPDGTRLAASCDKGLVMLKRGGGEKLFVREAPTLPALSFTPDGASVVGATWAYATIAVHAWSAKDGEPRREEALKLNAHPKYVQSLEFSRSGPWLLSAGTDGTAKIWDYNSGQLLRTLTGPDATIQAGFLPGEAGIIGAIKGWPSRIFVWDFESSAGEAEDWTAFLEATRARRERADSGEAMAGMGRWFARRGRWDWAARDLAAARGRGQGGGLALTEARAHRADGRPRAALAALAAAPQSEDILAGLTRDAVRREALERERMLKLPHAEDAAITSDGLALLAARNGPELWSLQRQRRVRSFPITPQRATDCVATMVGESFIAAGLDSGEIVLWWRRSAAQVARWKAQDKSIRDLLPFGERSLISCAGDGVRLWTMGYGLREPRATLDTGASKPRLLAPGASVKEVFIGCDDGLILLWDGKSPEPRRFEKLHDEAITALVMAPQSTFVASADKGGKVLIWDARTGKVIRDLQGAPPGEPMTGFAWSIDERTIYGVGERHSFRVWSVEAGRALRGVKGEDGASRVLLSWIAGDEGKRLIGIGGYGSARFWRAKE